MFGVIVDAAADCDAGGDGALATDDGDVDLGDDDDGGCGNIAASEDDDYGDRDSDYDDASDHHHRHHDDHDDNDDNELTTFLLL